MKIKRPKKINWCHPRKGWAGKHRVRTGDNWWNLAAKYGFADPWDIIQFNYGTKDPEEVNWYLREFVGCSVSKDGLNYSFDTSDRFGIVYLPPKGWKPTPTFEPSHAYSQLKESGITAGYFRNAPYINGAQISEIFSQRIFLVADTQLRAPVEYNYDNIIFVRRPQDPARNGTVDGYWFDKELIHLAYGRHGMNMPYSARTEAVALLGAMAVVYNYFQGIGKLPLDPFVFGGGDRQKINAAAQTFFAAYKANRATARLDEFTALIQKEPQLIKRLNGRWPIGNAA